MRCYCGWSYVFDVFVVAHNIAGICQGNSERNFRLIKTVFSDRCVFNRHCQFSEMSRSRIMRSSQIVGRYSFDNEVNESHYFVAEKCNAGNVLGRTENNLHVLAQPVVSHKLCNSQKIRKFGTQ